MGPLMFDHLFLCFSTALLCFLLGHEVDPDWTRHVRLLCVLQRALSAANSAHMCFGGPHTAAFSVRSTVCATLYQRHVCLWPPPHVWPCDHRWARAVMATWCFLLRGHSSDALPGGPLSPRCILRGPSCQRWLHKLSQWRELLVWFMCFVVHRRLTWAALNQNSIYIWKHVHLFLFGKLAKVVTAITRAACNSCKLTGHNCEC